jgi:hypothetical protein
MSFDVHLQLVEKYYRQGFSRSIVEEVFGPFLGSDGYRLSFPGGGGGDLYVRDKPMIGGFGVAAAGGLALYDAFYEVLRRVPGTYLYWPGGVVVADPATIPLLPSGIEEALGAATVVHSGQEIVEAIERGP